MLYSWQLDTNVYPIIRGRYDYLHTITNNESYKYMPTGVINDFYILMEYQVSAISDS